MIPHLVFVWAVLIKKKISVFDMSNKYQNFTDNYECQGHFND